MKVRTESRTNASHPGFSLIELVAVITLLTVLMLVIAATIWGVVKIERADSAAFHRMTVQAQLADRFREDVSQAVSSLDSLGELNASPTCLILRMADTEHLIYRWEDAKLKRRRTRRPEESIQSLAVGGERVSVEFDRSSAIPGVITMRLIESRGPSSSPRLRPVEISAALGGAIQ